MTSVGGKSNRNQTNKFVKWFEDYRKENTNISKWIRRLNGIFEQIEKFEKKLADKDVLGKKAEDQDKEVFESLDRDLSEMKRFAAEILAQIDKENPAIGEFLGRVSHDEITTAKFSFDTIKSYNQSKYQSVHSLTSLMPTFSKDLTGLVELPMAQMKDSAKFFVHFYENLVKAVKSEPSKGAMFESLGVLINYLIHYVGNVQTLSQNDKKRFVEFVKNRNPKAAKLSSNFLDAMGVAHNILDEMNTLLSKNDVSLASSKGEGSTYNSLDKEKQEKFDKFTKNTLLLLFKGTSEGNLLKIIKEKIYKEGDDKGDDKKKVDVEKRAGEVKSYVITILTSLISSGDVDDKLNGTITQPTLDSIKSNFKNLFKLLIGEKNDIKEDKGKYSFKDFEEIAKEICSTSTDKDQISNFLQLCDANFNSFKDGNLTSDNTVHFFKYLLTLIPLTFFQR